jgi:cob(I)alamin adenosyltransferase
MKIYTKTGDKGKTSLIGGKIVPKYHKRIEACGSVDELIAFVGLLRDSIENTNHKENLLIIQDRLMTIASLLSAESNDFRKSIPDLVEKDVLFLEKEIDRMENHLPSLHTFIFPGGHTLVSICHITRAVCRRAERNTVKVAGTSTSDMLILSYLNRLSDFLFVLSRLISNELGIKGIAWKPNL